MQAKECPKGAQVLLITFLSAECFSRGERKQWLCDKLVKHCWINSKRNQACLVITPDYANLVHSRWTEGWHWLIVYYIRSPATLLHTREPVVLLPRPQPCQVRSSTDVRTVGIVRVSTDSSGHPSLMRDTLSQVANVFSPSLSSTDWDSSLLMKRLLMITGEKTPSKTAILLSCQIIREEKKRELTDDLRRKTETSTNHDSQRRWKCHRWNQEQ